jgi:prepilin-type N-terminal cleavage/methylation domain-containing protein/prepilin-type processing-associated H-X9-DG protein
MFRGFTLIELLAVIGVFAILIGIILPITAKLRSAAHVVQCVSNMRQLGAASLMWSAENKNRIVYRPVYSEPYESWTYSLAPYLGLRGDEKTAPIFKCPGAHTKQPRTYAFNMNPGRNGEAFNPPATERYRLLSTVMNPSRYIMLFDIYYTGPADLGLWDNNTNSWRKSQDEPYPNAPLWSNYPRSHFDNKAVNLLFYDGHVGKHEYSLPDAFYYFDG